MFTTVKSNFYDVIFGNSKRTQILIIQIEQDKGLSASSYSSNTPVTGKDDFLPFSVISIHHLMKKETICRRTLIEVCTFLFTG